MQLQNARNISIVLIKFPVSVQKFFFVILISLIYLYIFYITAEAVGVTKLQLRNNLISWLKNNREKDTEIFVNFVMNPRVQAGLEIYLQSLKKK